MTRLEFLAAAMALGLALDTMAQEPAPKESPLEALTRRAELLQMTWPGNEKRASPTLLKTPVLRCNDLTREEMDGAVWLWLEGKRPVAAICLLRFASGKWNYELVSLTDDAVKVAGRPAWTWEPKAAARPWIKLAEPVPETSRARQQALRAIAHRWEATEFHKGETYVLRLLDRPLYSYVDEDHGVSDGALLALNYGTNPEILAQLEARKADGKLAWHAAFARLGSAALTVKLDGKEIWSADKVSAINPREPYFGVNESPE